MKWESTEATKKLPCKVVHQNNRGKQHPKDPKKILEISDKIINFIPQNQTYIDKHVILKIT